MAEDELEIPFGKLEESWRKAGNIAADGVTQVSMLLTKGMAFTYSAVMLLSLSTSRSPTYLSLYFLPEIGDI